MTRRDPEKASIETQAIAERYARRGATDRYSLLRPDVWQSVQERQRALFSLFRQLRITDVSVLNALDVGCGAGGNLLELLRLGFRPDSLAGVELLPDRFAVARQVLPRAVTLWQGDACTLPVMPRSWRLVCQSTVFSSLLDDDFQARLAAAMWSWVAPGGGVLWYDFIVDNPRNPDVRGVPLSRVRELFPQAKLSYRRVTLAPPLARAVCRVHPSLYRVFNTVPLLRTHVLAWLEKPVP
ncbi:MAG: class I SAM-dependent methyltransferase [Burkholderiales bacterium]|nr:class I SAM-dependent methyltransferase [Burkholderiales bacterium]